MQMVAMTWTWILLTAHRAWYHTVQSGSDDQELIPCLASQAAALTQQMQFMHAQQQTQLQAEQAAQQQALLQQQQQQWAASAVPRYQG